jgi:hypothetical protein
MRVMGVASQLCRSILMTNPVTALPVTALPVTGRDGAKGASREARDLLSFQPSI